MSDFALTGFFSKVLILFLAILSLFLIFINCKYLISSYHAKLGYKEIDHADIPSAIVRFEKAVKLDNINSEYYGKLSGLYVRMAELSKTEEEQSSWNIKAGKAAECAVENNPLHPLYREVLAKSYLSSKQYVKAYEQAEILITRQPKKPANYELLAQASLEAGLQYFREGNLIKAGDLIRKAALINLNPDARSNYTLNFYCGKALLITGDYKTAEKLLNSARNGTVNQKMDSDRLLYIVNEMTGRSKNNDKYKGVLWMGMVTKTPDYIEITRILKEKLIQ